MVPYSRGGNGQPSLTLTVSRLGENRAANRPATGHFNVRIDLFKGWRGKKNKERERLIH